MRAGRDVVRPENQRHLRALDHAAEERLRPGRMTDDTIESPGFDDRGQRPPGAANRLRAARAGFWKAMHGHAGRRELAH